MPPAGYGLRAVRYAASRHSDHTQDERPCTCYCGVICIGHMVEAEDGGRSRFMRLFPTAGVAPSTRAREKGRSETSGAHSEGTGW